MLKISNKMFPSISILIPTLNAARVLEGCLRSVKDQNYPKEKIEIIVADGGSSDRTLEIAQKYGAKIFQNPLKTGEAGKAVALKQAKGELIALIDSDNILPTRDWFLRMIEPFEDEDIFGSEPIKYTWRKSDGFITRYCALVGVNDPLCLFLGNYDRLNFLTDKWTEIKVVEEDKSHWLKISFQKGILPTIGANGTFLRRSIFKDFKVGNYFVDIDIIYDLVNSGRNKFAKVKVGIVHLYCGRNIGTFMRKQKRRIKDFLYFRDKNVRSYPWSQMNKTGIIKFILYCLTIFPLLMQTLNGYAKKRDNAWFFHPVACWLTLYIYAVWTIKGIFKKEALARDKWSQ